MGLLLLLFAISIIRKKMNLPVATAGAAGVESQGTPSLVEGKECYWRYTHPAI